MTSAPVREPMRRRLRIVAIATGLVLVPTVALATYPVIDTSALAQAAQRLSALKEQISLATKEIEETTKIFNVVTEISDFAQEQINAMGALGQIELPGLNLVRMATRLQRDAQCLMPDWEKLMPGMDVNDLDLSSICSAKEGYASALWFDPASADGLNWFEQEAARRQVKERRARVLQSAAIDGLAHADVVMATGSDDAEKATADLERAANQAEDMNTRLAVIAQGQVLIARQLGTQNQLLATLVKVQSAQAIQTGIDQKPLDAEASE